MKISIIFVNYNSSNKIEKCVRSIVDLENKELIDIVVVDNSRNFVNYTEINICLIENKENIGFGSAVNRGIPFTKSNTICVINPDTHFEVKFTDRVFNKLLDRSIGLLTLYQRDNSGRLLPTNGSFPNIFESLSWIIPTNSITKNIKNHFTLLQLPTGREKSVRNIAGAFIAFRKSCFIKVGGFDERYFLYYEDTDLSKGFLKNGYRNIILDSKTYIVHEIGNSDETQASKHDFMKHMILSRLKFLRKWKKNLLFLNKAIIIIYIKFKRIELSRIDLHELLKV